MVPKAVLVESSTTHLIISYSSFNKYSSFVTASFAFSYTFEVYQQTTVGASDITIRTIYFITINATPYCNTLIIKIF